MAGISLWPLFWDIVLPLLVPVVVAPLVGLLVRLYALTGEQMTDELRERLKVVVENGLKAGVQFFRAKLEDVPRLPASEQELLVDFAVEHVVEKAPDTLRKLGVKVPAKGVVLTAGQKKFLREVVVAQGADILVGAKPQAGLVRQAEGGG